MTLPASGPISMSQVANELVISQTGLSLNHFWVRTLANKASGAISLNDLHGQTGKFNAATSASSNIIQLHSAPFFGGTLLDVEVLTDGVGNPINLTVNMQTTGRWMAGNIRLTNQSTGATVVMTPNGSIGWISGFVANIVRNGASADVLLIQVV